MDPFEIPAPALRRTIPDIAASRALASYLNATQPSEAGWTVSVTGSVMTELYHPEFLGVTAVVVAFSAGQFLAGLPGGARVAVCATLAECQTALENAR